MNKFYIISNKYEPNTASTNHALSFVRAFSEKGIHAEWVLVLPSPQIDDIKDAYMNITIKCLSPDQLSGHKYLKHAYKWKCMLSFRNQVHSGDTLLFLGGGEYIKLFMNIKGVRIFHERTEHSDVVKVGHLPWTNTLYKKWITRIDGLFVISHKLKEHFISIGCPAKNVHVINMVVDSTRFEGLEKQPVEDHYIAYCGNASNSKDGVDGLIRAFSYVVEVYPDEKLYIIGGKPQGDSENEKLVRQLGLTKNVVFCGIIPYAQMPQMLKNADALALCRPSSLQNEMGFPTKLGEYLLTGNPVIVTKVGDIPRFLYDGESALMVDTTDIEGFGQKMLWVLQHKEEAMKIGKRGKEVAEKSFNYQIESQKLIDVIFEKSVTCH